MAFKGEIGAEYLDSVKTGHNEGDIYRIIQAGKLAGVSMPFGTFVRWKGTYWEVIPNMQYATSKTGKSLDKAISDVLDDKSDSDVYITIETDADGADAYTVGYYFEDGGEIYKCTDKQHSGSVYTITGKKENGVLPVINAVGAGIPEQVSNLVALKKWERVEDKIGHLNSSTISPTNIEIHYNRTLSLIFLRFYARWSSTSTGWRDIYDFNEDLPGINETQSSKGIFTFTSAGWCDDSKCGHVACQPYDTQDTIAKKITVSCVSFYSCSFAALMRFNSDLKQEFEAYIDA